MNSFHQHCHWANKLVFYTTYLVLQLVFLQLLQNKIDLFVCEQRGDISAQVFAVVLGVIVALPAGVDPQAGLPDVVPALPTQLACNPEPHRRLLLLHLSFNPD